MIMNKTTYKQHVLGSWDETGQWTALDSTGDAIKNLLENLGWNLYQGSTIALCVVPNRKARELNCDNLPDNEVA